MDKSPRANGKVRPTARAIVAATLLHSLLAGTACGSRTPIDFVLSSQASQPTGRQEAGPTGGDRITGGDPVAIDAATFPPFDLRTAPAYLEMTCQEMESNIQLQLPCQVGMNLSGSPESAGINIVQCDLGDKRHRGVLAMIVPLGDFGNNRLHQPINIESELSVVPSSEVELSTRFFRGLSASGTLVLDHVDLAARSFDGHVYNFNSDWTDKVSGKHSWCRLPDGPIWAVPGNFL